MRHLFFVSACLLAIGLAGIVALVPPMAGLDERDHLYRTVQVSQGHILPEVAPYGDRARIAGGEIDDHLSGLLAPYFDNAMSTLTSTPFVRPSVREISSHLALRQAGVARFQPFTNTAIYPPTAYAVPAAAVALARGLGLPLLAWLYAGRLAGAICAAALILIGIRRSGSLQPYYTVLSSVPMMLSQGGTLTADTLVLAACFPLAAMIARLVDSDEVSPRDAVILAGLAVVICVGKLAYLPLVVLPAGIAGLVQGWRSPSFRRTAAGAAVAVLLWAAWSWQIGDKIFSPRLDLPEMSPGAQLHWIAGHPFAFVRVLARSMVDGAPGSVPSMLGARLFYEHVHIRVWFVGVLALVLACLGLARSSWRRTDRRILGLTLLALAACYVAVYVLLYLQFTPTGGAKVEGIQGRYFLPLAILAPLALARSRLGSGGRRALVGATIVQGISVAVTLLATWWSFWA